MDDIRIDCRVLIRKVGETLVAEVDQRVVFTHYIGDNGQLEQDAEVQAAEAIGEFLRQEARRRNPAAK